MRESDFTVLLALFPIEITLFSLKGCQVQQSLAYGLGIKDKYVVTGDPKLGTVTFTNTYKGIVHTR